MSALPMINPDDFKYDQNEMAMMEAHAASAINEAREKALSIDSPAKRDDAADWIRKKMNWIRDIENGFIGTMKKNLFAMHKAASKKERELCDPVQMGITIVNQAITEYNVKVERQRQELERQRVAEEKKKHEEQCLKDAQAHDEAGNQATVDAALANVDHFVAPVIPQEKGKGIIARKYWKAEVTDKRQLLKYLAEKPGYENAVDVNTTWLATQAKLMDGNLSVPGVRFWQQDGTTIR